jgi:FKBP-type peptidyl-prolyl cis-trans isomerase FkpA
MSAQPPFSLPADEACTTTPSGLKYEVIEEGAGRMPNANHTVTVHYAGWLTDGTPFDSSYERGQTIAFPLNRVIAGWTEGLQLMREGATYKFVIPPDLAYGSAGAPPTIGPNETLVFQVELLKVG